MKRLGAIEMMEQTLARMEAEHAATQGSLGTTSPSAQCLRESRWRGYLVGVSRYLLSEAKRKSLSRIVTSAVDPDSDMYLISFLDQS